VWVLVGELLLLVGWMLGWMHNFEWEEKRKIQSIASIIGGESKSLCPRKTTHGPAELDEIKAATPEVGVVVVLSILPLGKSPLPNIPRPSFCLNPYRLDMYKYLKTICFSDSHLVHFLNHAVWPSRIRMGEWS
jgi:hypothetical protein